MENKIRANGLFMIMAFLLLATAVSSLPSELTLQGKLTSNAGVSQVGTINMSFKIYDAFTAGSLLYESNQNIVTDSNGVYDAILRSINLSFDIPYYLGITIGTDAESSPRINLTSSPYSFRSNISESLNPLNSYAMVNLSVRGNITLGTETSTITITSQSANLTQVGSLSLAQNLTLGQRISFSFGNVIESLLSGIRITGNTNIVGNADVSGTITAPTINATVANLRNITLIDLALGWTNLTTYPAACPVGQFVTTVGDTLTCQTPGQTSSAAGGWANDSENTYSSLNIVVDVNDFVINTSSNTVGIGVSNPTDRLEVVGNVRISGTLNASFINASQGIQIRGNAVQEELIAFKNGNFTALYDARLDRFLNSNFTALYDARSDRFGNANFTSLYDAKTDRFSNENMTAILDNATIIRSGNSSWWSALYDLRADRFGNSNFTALYDARSDRFANLNFTSLYDARADRFSNANYTTLEAGSFQNANFTALYDARSDRFGNANFTASLAAVNDSLALWNISGNSIFPRNISMNVGIGTSSPAVSLVVIGKVNISDSLNVSGTIQAARFVGDGSALTGIIAGGSSPWNSSNTNVFLNESAANVGIGTTTPQSKLDVAGSVKLSTSNSFVNISGMLVLQSGNDLVISD